MEVANTLALYVMATVTAFKSFIVQAPGLKPLILGWSASADGRYNQCEQWPVL
jgi:hypothetical protein